MTARHVPLPSTATDALHDLLVDSAPADLYRLTDVVGPRAARVLVQRDAERRRAEDTLQRTVTALASVLAEADAGDELHVGDLLAALRKAGTDVHDLMVSGIEEAAALRTAEVGGAW